MVNAGDRTSEAYAVASGTCSTAAGITSGMLVEAVDNAYKSNTDYWDKSAVIVFGGVLHHVCLKYINEERAKLGLKLWSRWEGRK